jgi:hypothetical protein
MDGRLHALKTSAMSGRYCITLDSWIERPGHDGRHSGGPASKLGNMPHSPIATPLSRLDHSAHNRNSRNEDSRRWSQRLEASQRRRPRCSRAPLRPTGGVGPEPDRSRKIATGAFPSPEMSRAKCPGDCFNSQNLLVLTCLVLPELTAMV